MATISAWRRKIDKLDKKLVRLLNERAKYTDKIGKLKEKLGLGAYSPEREEEILRNVLEWNEGPLPTDVLRRLYERILDESRTLERETIQDRKLKTHSGKQNSPPRRTPLRLRRANK